MGSFITLLGDRAAAGAPRSVPLLGYAKAGNAGFFDDQGFPAGRGWDDVDFPGISDARAYALKISGDSMKPLYRSGDIIVVSPQASLRAGDRVVLKTRGGEVMAKELVRQNAQRVELRSLNPDHGDRTVPRGDIQWMARIIWARAIDLTTRPAAGVFSGPPRRDFCLPNIAKYSYTWRLLEMTLQGLGHGFARRIASGL